MKKLNFPLLGLVCLPTALHAEPVIPSPSPAVPVIEGIISVPNGDPFADPTESIEIATLSPGRTHENRPKIQLRMETWEAPTLEVVRFLDTADGATDIANARAACLSGEADARLVFNSTAGLDAHTKCLSEAIVERIYPTEYEPPELPPRQISPDEARSESDAWVKWLQTAGKHAVPTAFETRNTGETFGAIAQPVAIASNTWDISISFESVKYLGPVKHGASDLLIEMPVFSTFQISGLYRMKEGEWRLLSVQNPPPALDGEVPDKNWVTFLRIDPTP